MGITASSDQMLTVGQMLTLHGTVAWQYAFQKIMPSSSLAFASTGATLLVSGVPIVRDSALIDIGGELRFRPAVSLEVAYSGQFARRFYDNGIKGRVAYQF